MSYLEHLIFGAGDPADNLVDEGEDAQRPFPPPAMQSHVAVDEDDDHNDDNQGPSLSYYLFGSQDKEENSTKADDNNSDDHVSTEESPKTPQDLKLSQQSVLKPHWDFAAGL